MVIPKEKMNEAVECYWTLHRLTGYEKPFVQIWGNLTGGAVQMREKDFKDTFDQFTVVKEPSDGNFYQLRAYAYYMGVVFFTLLEKEDDDENVSASKG